MKLIFSIFIAFLPQVIKKFFYRKIFKFSIGENTYLGCSLLAVNHLTLGNGARIGNFNIIKGLQDCIIEENAHIGSFNYISGTNHSNARNFFGETPSRILRLGRESSITGFHYFDVTDMIIIEHFTVIAGKGSQFWTHGINIEQNRQSSGPISIGSYCLVNSAVRFLANTSVPDYSVIGAGAVVTKNISEEYSLIGGIPARVIKKLNPDSAFFLRRRGDVPWS